MANSDQRAEARQPPDMWWWAQFGRQHGPIPLSELKEKLQGVDSPEIFVWRAGLEDWKHVEDVPEVMPPRPPQPPPLPSHNQKKPRAVFGRGVIKRIPKELWYGQYSLAATFWLFYFGGYFLVVLALLAIVYLSGGAKPVVMFSFFAQSLYLFVASVGVWISADRAESRVEAWWARAWVLMFGLYVIHNVYRHDLPQLLNNLTGR
jgi:hypothetical protein